MNCATARAAISVQLDGESAAIDPEVETHVLGCAACSAWRQRARELTGMVRREFTAAPDLTINVLENVAARARAEQAAAVADRDGRRRVLRWAVGAAAVVQLVLAIPALLAATGVTDLLAVHASREMASFDIAVAVGFLLAAIRPERARAFVPVALVLALCLAVTAGVDVVRGATSLADESGHLVALAQAGLLWALVRHQPRAESAADRSVAT